MKYKYVYIFSCLTLLLSGCGVSSIRCEIVSDEELIRSVLEEVIVNGQAEEVE